MSVARTRGSFALAQREQARGRRNQKPPQTLSTEVVEQAGETWLTPANAPGKGVSGGGPLDTVPQDDATDA
ncbi:hypothetical protein [Streptomyces jumonjinensis]|uniref:hypothetical protein n=1 Tax=Streptomyces jumonjinensis TaxID=1945 RepID=UPI0037B776D4